MSKHNQLLRGFIIIIMGLLLGSIVFFLSNRNSIPAKAQAQELFTLYFEMDHVRQDSAHVMAELMRAATDPAQVGAVEAIGSKPPLSSQQELVDRLQQNRFSIEQALAIVNEKRFTDPEVDLRYADIQAFYTALFGFEDMVLTNLSTIGNEREKLIHLGTIIFEGEEWTALLAQDIQLRTALTSLATLHSLEFTSLAYEDLFRDKLIELDTPIISDEVNTIVYPFTVDESATNKVVISVEFDIKLSDQIKISLEDPRGHIIASDQLAKYDDTVAMTRLSQIYRDESAIGITLFPDDPLVMPIIGEWKLYVTAPVGSSMVIGFVQL